MNQQLLDLLEKALPQGSSMPQGGPNCCKKIPCQDTSSRSSTGSPDALAHLITKGNCDALAALHSFQDEQQQQAQQQMIANNLELENLFNRLSSSSSSATLNGSSISASPVSSLNGDPNSANGLPSSTTVNSQTDVMQASSCVNWALSQPNGPSSFVLQPQAGPHGCPGSQAALNMALRVAVSARKLHASTYHGTDVDIAVLPVVSAGEPHLGSTSPADAVELHVYRCSVPSMSATGPSAHTLKVDPGSPPLVLGLQLAQLLTSALHSSQGCGVVDVMFGAASAKVGLQALAVARSHLSAAGQDYVLLPQQVEGNSSASSPWLMRMLHSKLLVLASAPAAPTSQLSVTPAFSRQSTNGPNNVLGGSGTFSSLSYTQDPPSLSSISDGGPPPATNPMAPPSPLLASTLLARGYGSAYAYTQQAAQLGQLQQAALRGMVPLGAATAVPSAGMGMGGIAYGGMGLQGMGMGVAGNDVGLGSAAAMVAAAASLAAAARPRARKADWVIVTEDTAIKNAAGAVAKVLGRVAGAGLCCPVFTEKKTDKYTAVVSVAVKAIAVARGYVVNEGTGHEVAFQPYLRNDPTSGLGPRPPGAPVSPASPPPLSIESLTTGPSSLETLFGASPPSTLGLASSFARISSSSTLTGVEPSGGSGSSVHVTDDESGLAEVERSEMAFDVYKVPQVPEAAGDSGALPVKVTAHSRPGVVSNIIAKLVHERDSAVLITAGGRAMHVAMMAVVAARSRLRARGIDVLLLPKFVTVDTTSTLGWESVFLRFHIIRAPMGSGMPASVAVASSAAAQHAAAVEASNRLAMFSRMSA